MPRATASIAPLLLALLAPTLAGCGGTTAHAAPAMEAADGVRHLLVIRAESLGEIAIDVLHIDHQVVVPDDPQTGRPSGAREHSPLSVTTPRVDETSALLVNLLIRNELLTSAVLTSYRTRDGVETAYRTITLTSGLVIGHRLESDVDASLEREHVSLFYEGIEWHWPERAITVTDTLPPGP